MGCEDFDETDNAEIAILFKFLGVEAAIDGDALSGNVPSLP